MKKLIVISLLLTGCVAVPYGPTYSQPYTYGAPHYHSHYGSNFNRYHGGNFNPYRSRNR